MLIRSGWLVIPESFLHLDHKILVALGEFRQVEFFGYFAALSKLQHEAEGLDEYPFVSIGTAAYFFIKLSTQGHVVNAFFTAF